MSSISWYWHRLKAMGPLEIATRVQTKARAFADAHRQRDWQAVPLEPPQPFPLLPARKEAPPELRAALAGDVEAILKGEWLAFGRIPLRVDDPPKWHCDPIAHRDVATRDSAFELDHRKLPGGADIKVIWELSRWFQLLRLAQASWLESDKRAFEKCIAWLVDWTSHNPPYRGWNWTSALESGIRLIQFAWIDAFLSEAAKEFGSDANLSRLRHDVLPAHVWFTWRHKSFGSSANNHLLGELSGLIFATNRWPALAHWGAPMKTLHQLWEREVLAQFADDGGNLEQALNYHLFSFEFAWQARMALHAAGLGTSTEVDDRLSRAATFFLQVQEKREPWDYGDSDNAFVSPLFISARNVVEEWYSWFEDANTSPALRYYLGNSPARSGKNPWLQLEGFKFFPKTGIAVAREGDWFLRWDLSPLGYLSTAAHGHLDALHVSIWFRKKAMAIDPGTGAYYADKAVRNYLSSLEAHNGPRVEGEPLAERLGPFLWTAHHGSPTLQRQGENTVIGRLRLGDKVVSRTIKALAEGWEITDCVQPQSALRVRWQFPPGTVVSELASDTFRMDRDGVSLWIQFGEGATAELKQETASAASKDSFAGICSPAFRKIDRGPCLDVEGKGHKPCVLRTTFLASLPS